jgi:hypothetical protein
LLPLFIVAEKSNFPARRRNEKKQLQEHVKTQLFAPYKYPREIEFVAALPRTETGKLQRFKLRTAHDENSAAAGWAKPEGFSNGIRVEGERCIRRGPDRLRLSKRIRKKDFAGQFRQTLKNTLAVLAEAGGKPEHIVRMTWYILDKQEYLGA